MRAAFLLLALLTVAGCSSQFDASKVKMNIDGADAYRSAKIGVGQPF
jgi:hypothetical protein